MVLIIYDQAGTVRVVGVVSLLRGEVLISVSSISSFLQALRLGTVHNASTVTEATCGDFEANAHCT